MIELYLQMGIALVLVTGLIAVLGIALRKRQGQGGLMKVIGYQSLGPKKGIAMVKVGAEVLLVGVTANDIKLLKTMGAVAEEPADRTAPEAANAIVTADAPDALGKLKAWKDTLKDALYANK